MLEQKSLNAPPPFSQRIELEAALWWRLGEAYQYDDERKSLTWYDKSLQYLEQEDDLKEAIAERYCIFAYKLMNEKKYVESVDLLNKAVALKPGNAWAYSLLGDAYSMQKQYVQAIENFDISVHLKSDNAVAYYNRGIICIRLRQYIQAIENFDIAIRLVPVDAGAYLNRAYAHLYLRNVEQARADFARAAELQPRNVDKGWMVVFSSMQKERSGPEVAEQLEIFAAMKPQSLYAGICSAVASGLRGKPKDGLAILEQVLQKKTWFEDAHFWKGMLSAYYYRNKPQIAVEAIEKALEQGYRLCC